MVDANSIRGDDIRELFVKKPEVLAKFAGVDIKLDTVKNEHWIDVKPGRQKIDFYCEDNEGKYYVIKVAFKEKPLNAVRHPNIWQKRVAEMYEIDENKVLGILLIDEETVTSSPRNQKDIDAFPNIKTVQYKIADIIKEM
jgi:hypothetical protein